MLTEVGGSHCTKANELDMVLGLSLTPNSAASLEQIISLWLNFLS